MAALNDSRCYVVFSDLDGTMLDHHTYAYEAALPGLRLLQERKVPLIFCSAKTRAEQAVYRQALQVRDPFIVENGGAVVVEQDYFKQPVEFTRMDNGCGIIELARPNAEVRKVLALVREELGLPLRGYGDMSLEEVGRITGLTPEAAARAARREYEETMVTPLTDDEKGRLVQACASHGVKITTGARFISLSTSNDKGRAARLLMDLFRRELGDIVTVGIGDSWNDTPLLKVMDIPMLVQGPDGKWADLSVAGLRRINGVGPQGWTMAMRQLLKA